MKKNILTSILFLVVIVFFFNGLVWGQKEEAPSAEETFYNPTLKVNDRYYPLNYCLDPYEKKGCKDGAARFFCRYMGYNNWKTLWTSECGGTSSSYYENRFIAWPSRGSYKCIVEIICVN